MFSGPLSVEHMQRQTRAQKEGFWLLADLFTQPCPLSADTQSGSSSCAESSWLVLLSGRGNIRRLITLSFKSSLPDLGPSGKEKWCHWRSALKPLCLYEAARVTICCHIGLWSPSLLRSLTCLGVWRSNRARISLRNEKRAHAITLTALMLPTFYVMVFDTRVSSEQTVKQQEHICRVWHRWAWIWKSSVLCLQPKRALMSLGCFRRMFE